ncbi:MAG: LTA synthase family protein [Erysipelotrichaceae bacterium]
MMIISLFAYLLFGLLVYPYIPTLVLRLILIGIYLLFFVLDLGAIYAKGTHFSLAFAANIEKKVIEMMFTSFLPMTIATVVVYVLAIVLIGRFDAWIISQSLALFDSVLLVILTVVLALQKEGVLVHVLQTIRSLLSRNKATSVSAISDDFNFSKPYVEKSQLVCEPGKNTIVIYLESMDQNFLNEALFPGLLPKLKARMQRWTCYNQYVPYKGIDYTMGALYGTQTGLPNYFGLRGNNVFSMMSSTRAASIGTILHRAGYDQLYLNGGDLLFAGKGNFFDKHQYRTIGIHDFDPALPRSEWGVHDADLFERAKEELAKLRNKKQPYNVTMLTLDMHFPDGLEDPRIATQYDEGHGILNTAARLDDVLDDFLNHLEQQSDYENTAIYIMADHPLMGINRITRRLNKQKRDLFLLTNVEPTTSYPDVSAPIYFYDIPKLVLEGARVKHNASFLPELLPNISYSYIDHHIGAFTRFNYLLHHFSHLQESVTIERFAQRVQLKSANHTLASFVCEEGQIECFVFTEEGLLVGQASQSLKESTPPACITSVKELILGYYLEDNQIHGVILDRYMSVLYEFDTSEPLATTTFLQYFNKDV